MVPITSTSEHDDFYAGTYPLDVTEYVPPPVYTYDQIAGQLVNGYWAATGSQSHQFNVTAGGSLTVNVTGLTDAGLLFAREALALWSDVTGINFTALATGGQITFDDNDTGADTLNYSGYTSNQRIDLRAETFSNIGTGVGNVSIARGVVIENAMGGSGNDTMFGNAANNILNGGGGADTLRGGDGDDIYIVDDAGDRAIEISSTSGTDLVKSYVSFTLRGFAENLALMGSSAINGTGNSLNNKMYGNGLLTCLIVMRAPTPCAVGQATTPTLSTGPAIRSSRAARPAASTW